MENQVSGFQQNKDIHAKKCYGKVFGKNNSKYSGLFNKHIEID